VPSAPETDVADEMADDEADDAVAPDDMEDEMIAPNDATESSEEAASDKAQRPKLETADAMD